MSIMVAHQDQATTATLFTGMLYAIERSPRQWEWPDQSAEYLRHRLAGLTSELVATDAGLEAAA